METTINPSSGNLDVVGVTSADYGVLDARYLKLDASKDPVTGVLTLNVGQVSLGSGTISYDTENRVSSVTRTGGRTITFTRGGYGVISSWTDETNTWVLTRAFNGGRISAWTVS